MGDEVFKEDDNLVHKLMFANQAAHIEGLEKTIQRNELKITELQIEVKVYRDLYEKLLNAVIR